MLKNKSLFLLVVLIVNTLPSFTQINTISPYSRFGLGDLHFNGFSQNIHLAGLTTPLKSPYNINVKNPASYSSIQLTSFEIAFGTTYHKSENDSLSENNYTNFLQHIALGFPISKKWGLSIGLYPYSSVGYSVKETINDLTSSIEYIYEGDGGLNTFYLGSSVDIIKGLSLGLNAKYQFGSLEQLISVEFDTSSIFNNRNITSAFVSDFSYDFGLLYDIPLKNDIDLTLGGTYGPKISLTTQKKQLVYTYSENNGFEIIKDTILNSSNSSDEIIYPSLYSGGIAIGKKDKWFIGIEYEAQNWSEYQFLGEKDSLINSTRYALGFYFIPNNDAINKLSNRIQYRGGLFYHNSPILLNSTQLKDFGLSFGLGIPLRKQFSTLNIGFLLGQRGTINNNLIRERYFNINFGVTINDKWFIKRKIE